MPKVILYFSNLVNYMLILLCPQPNYLLICLLIYTRCTYTWLNRFDSLFWAQLHIRITYNTTLEAGTNSNLKPAFELNVFVMINMSFKLGIYKDTCLNDMYMPFLCMVGGIRSICQWKTRKGCQDKYKDTFNFTFSKIFHSLRKINQRSSLAYI